MKQNTWNLLVCGLSHDHVWGELEHWNRIANVTVLGAGEADARLRGKFAEMFPAAELFESWEQALSQLGDAADIVQIAAPNALHPAIAMGAFQHQCHVITEKPMASTLAGADAMLQASLSARKSLMVNWPIAWMSAFQLFQQHIENGTIGNLSYIRYRSAHNGPLEIGCDPAFVAWLYDEQLNGAGAFMDYCCYGSVIAAHHLGLPHTVTGIRGKLAKAYDICDDNAVVTMQYDSAMAVAEASWTQVTGYLGANPVAYGSLGAVGLERGILVLLDGKDNRTEIEPPTPLFPFRNGPENFINHLETGEPIFGVCDAKTSRNAQAILEAGLIASKTGHSERARSF